MALYTYEKDAPNVKANDSPNTKSDRNSGHVTYHKP
jgi:hypothetical protein